jgi:hypothetical protein
VTEDRPDRPVLVPARYAIVGVLIGVLIPIAALVVGGILLGWATISGRPKRNILMQLGFVLVVPATASLFAMSII